MSQSYIPTALRQAIVTQFASCCAFCQTQQLYSGIKLTVDHIVPESLGGETVLDNLCLACWDCNLAKGARIVGRDPLTDEMVRLFHPQQSAWDAHFEWSRDATRMIGRTPIGRATIETLNLNRSTLIRSRQFWTQVGWHPPK